VPNSNTNSLEAGVVLSELCWLLAAGLLAVLLAGSMSSHLRKEVKLRAEGVGPGE